MKEKPPFLEDGSQFGVSRTSFRRMRKAEKLELMVGWFNQHFEDPAENTSYVSAEGGYLWNHGGPYEARDELYSKFGGIVSEKLIEEAVEEVERGGITDWTGVDSGEGLDEMESPDELEELSSLERFSDQPTSAYGTSQDHEARARARSALDRLQEALERSLPAGIGHNRPPATEHTEQTQLRAAITELKSEFAKPNPAITFIQRWTKPLRDALVAIGKWGAKKLDKAADAAVTTAAGGTVVWVGSHYSEELLAVVKATRPSSRLNVTVLPKATVSVDVGSAMT
jgi:hypothetical protein